MNTRDAVAARRSIRRFKIDLIPDEDLQAILQAAGRAPSGKNRQAWRFVVVSGAQRAEMLARMRAGIAQMKVQGQGIGSSV